MNYQALVTEFIEKFDANRDPKFWVKLIEEEANEVIHAVADLYKELADLVYVTNGFFAVGGDDEAVGDIPGVNKAIEILGALENIFTTDIREEAFRRVHESNMSKLDPETGKPIRREDGKILKPLTYKPPVLVDLV